MIEKRRDGYLHAREDSNYGSEEESDQAGCAAGHLESGRRRKEGYEHFMLKEIHEQPKAIRETLMRRLDDDDQIKLDGISLTLEDLENFNKIYIVACGTAYHAGLVGKYAIEKMARVPVEVDVASEFRYRDPFVDDKTLFIAISQSGETPGYTGGA